VIAAAGLMVVPNGDGALARADALHNPRELRRLHDSRRLCESRRLRYSENVCTQ
jgi:hypothetical protein